MLNVITIIKQRIYAEKIYCALRVPRLNVNKAIGINQLGLVI